MRRRHGLGQDVSGKWSDFCVGCLSKHPEPEGFRVEMFHPSGLRSRIFWRQSERDFDPVYRPPDQKRGGFGIVRETKDKFRGQSGRDLKTWKRSKKSTGRFLTVIFRVPLWKNPPRLFFREFDPKRGSKRAPLGPGARLGKNRHEIRFCRMALKDRGCGGIQGEQ